MITNGVIYNTTRDINTEGRKYFIPKRVLPVASLILFSLILAFKNYTPGTWLIGWDNMMSEFNFSLNIQRSLFAVWQEYQGLGLLGGMAHAGDLPRQIFLLILSTIFNTNILRYLYQFIMLILGPVGVYLLIKNVFFEKIDNRGREIASFLGGLFYLLNLSTLQTFYIPASMFTTQYGLLPYLLMYTFLYLSKRKKVYLNYFALFSFLALPMAYTPTLFFAYFSVLGIISLHFIYKNKEFKPVLNIILTIFIINAYWFLPFMYFSATKSQDLINAKINRFASEDGFLRNKEMGNIKNVALLKGFWFEFVEMQPNQKFDYLMPKWRSHLSNPSIENLGYIVFIVVLIGIVYALYKKYNFSKVFLLIFLFSLFILINENPPLGFIFKFLRGHISIFKEALRFPFTKYSTIAALSYSVFFASGIKFIYLKIENLFKKLSGPLILTLFTLILIILLRPAFSGHLISEKMRINIPQEYFDLFKYFEKQDKDKRIADFPQSTFWGWQYYDWGYIGSGFLWYGIEQPILDRAFDVWSSANEAYYEEMSHAIYSKDTKLFEHLLEKYQIDYLLLDKNVISATDEKVLYYPELEKLFLESNKVELTKEFNNIMIYKTNLSYTSSNYISSQIGQNIGPSYEKSLFDQAHSDHGLYYSKSSNFDRYYMFRNEDFKVSEVGSEITIKAIVPDKLKQGILKIPDYTLLERSLPAFITKDGKNLKLIYQTPTININDGSVTRRNSQYFELTSGSEDLLGWSINDEYLGNENEIILKSDKDNALRVYGKKEGKSYEISDLLFSQNIEQCNGEDLLYNQYYTKKYEKGTLELEARGTTACVFINLAATLKETKRPSLIKVEVDYKIESDEEPFFCLYNSDKNACLNKQEASINHILKDWQKYEQFIDVSGFQIDKLWLQLLLDAKDKNKSKNISYKNFTLKTFPTIYESLITTDALHNKVGGVITLPVKAHDVVSLTLKKYPQKYLSKIDTKAENCDNFNNTYFAKKVIKTKNLLRFSSEDATSCDHVKDIKLSENQAHLMVIKSRNITGTPLIICLEDTESKRCVVHEILSDNEVWTENTFVFPAVVNPVLHLYNRSVGKEKSINEINDLEFYKLPIYYLKNIEVIKESQHNNSPIEKANISNIIKSNPSSYRLKITGESKSLLVLNQAYDPGWIIFSTNHMIGEHVLVNNWANGWLIPKGERIVTILYLPQLFEYLGFLIMGIWITINLTKRNNSVI